MTTHVRTRHLGRAAVAGAAGVLLLTGGGGTFAVWSDTAALGNDTTITSGTLALEPSGQAAWTDARGTVIDPAGYVVVPGDTLTYTEDLTIRATGDHLAATLTTNLAAPTVTGDAELAAALRRSAVFTVDGVPYERLEVPITSADDGATLTVELSVTFDERTLGTIAQDQTVNLSAVDVVLTQDA